MTKEYELEPWEKEWMGFPADGRAELQPEIDRLRAALEACLERLRLVSDDSESSGFIESCQPVIAQAEAALNHE